MPHTSAYVSIRQHKSAYVIIRQHTSAYVRTHAQACVCRACSSLQTQCLGMSIYIHIHICYRTLTPARAG
jgi:hypothetical protein